MNIVSKIAAPTSEWLRAHLLSCAPGKAGLYPTLFSHFPLVSFSLKLGKEKRAISQGPRRHHYKSKGTKS